MPQAPRQLRPELSGRHLFGARLRAWRERRGLSQRALGEIVLCSGHLIGKIEKGERRPQDDLVRRCDEALGAEGDLIAIHAASRSSAPSGTGHGWRLASQLPELRRVIDSRDLPQACPVLSVSLLRQSIVEMVDYRVNARYADLAARLIEVLPQLHQATQHAPDSPKLRALLVQAYRCADAIADKLGLHDLSARIIDLMCAAASKCGDELLAAATCYVRAETFFANGDWTTGRQVLDRAAEGIDPTTGVRALATYGALRMRAAVLAAREGRADPATERIAEAVDAARHVPDDVYLGTAFGPASVRIHQFTLALDLHDIGGALKTGGQWIPPLTIPCERRSHYFVDLARAYAAADLPDNAVDYLHVARLVAPEHIRHHPDVKVTVTRLLVNRLHPSRLLLDMARWIGVGPSGSRSQQVG